MLLDDIDDEEKRKAKTKLTVRGQYKVRSHSSSKNGNDIQLNGFLKLINYYESKPYKGNEFTRRDPGGVTLNLCDQSDNEFDPVERDLHLELTADVINEILGVVRET